MTKNSELILGAIYGDTTKQLTDLVMAAEHAFDSYGKRSIFGQDKGKAAEEKFNEALVRAILALEKRGLIKDASDASDSFRVLELAMSRVRETFPNWPRAYRYWDEFLVRMSQEGRM